MGRFEMAVNADIAGEQQPRYRERLSGALVIPDATAWLEQAVQDSRSQAMLAFEIDHFLHAIGVLKITKADEVAAALVRKLKESSIDSEVCLLQTGQYAALFPGVREAQAAADDLVLFARESFRSLADTVRAGSQAKGLTQPGPRVLTVSVGIAPRPDSGDIRAKDWLDRAQEAAARAAGDGMDRVEISD